MKNRILILILVLFPGIFLSLNISFSSDELPDYYKAATHLYKDGYYSEARAFLLEMIYNKILTSPFNLYSKFLIAMTYAKDANLSKSITELTRLQRNMEDINKLKVNHKNLYCEINYQIAKLYFFEKRIDLFLEEKEHFDTECPVTNKDIVNELNILEIASFVYEMRWKDALYRIKRYNFDNLQLRDYLRTKIKEIVNHREKSPLIGGILSILPGLGHIYAGRLSDGIRSFLFNSTFTGLTIYTAVHKEYSFAVLFGLVESVLYASNIYGGINAVMQENALYYTKNRDEILKGIPVSSIKIITIKKEIGL